MPRDNALVMTVKFGPWSVARHRRSLRNSGRGTIRRRRVRHRRRSNAERGPPFDSAGAGLIHERHAANDDERDGPGGSGRLAAAHRQGHLRADRAERAPGLRDRRPRAPVRALARRRPAASRATSIRAVDRADRRDPRVCHAHADREPGQCRRAGAAVRDFAAQRDPGDGRAAGHGRRAHLGDAAPGPPGPDQPAASDRNHLRIGVRNRRQPGRHLPVRRLPAAGEALVRGEDRRACRATRRALHGCAASLPTSTARSGRTSPSRLSSASYRASSRGRSWPTSTCSSRPSGPC